MIKNQQGVTLIELLVVVVILGIIAAVAIPAIMGNQKDAYINTNLQNQAIINEAVQRYVIDHGGTYYPTATGGGDNDEGIFTAELVPAYLQELPVIFFNDGDSHTHDDTGTTYPNWYISDQGIVLVETADGVYNETGNIDIVPTP